MPELINLLATNNWLLLITILLIGLCFGSFLNVVRVRFPTMLTKTWQAQCREFLALTAHIATPTVKAKPTLTSNSIIADLSQENLFKPRSFCPHCKKQICWRDNIPLISFILLGGKCRNCHTSISWHYPIVELTTGLCSMLIAYKFGFTWQLAGALVLTWILIVQAWIDFEHTLLPDEITLPGLWLGLLLNSGGIFVDPTNAIVGAIAGYLSLWSIYWFFKLLTNKEGMGYGDFKLLAMLGAWLGWQQLPLIILLSSGLGAIMGISLVIGKFKQYSAAIPFGPYIAIAGLIALIWGDKINNWYLHTIGF